MDATRAHVRELIDQIDAANAAEIAASRQLDNTTKCRDYLRSKLIMGGRIDKTSHCDAVKGDSPNILSAMATVFGRDIVYHDQLFVGATLKPDDVLNPLRNKRDDAIVKKQKIAREIAKNIQFMETSADAMINGSADVNVCIGWGEWTTKYIPDKTGWWVSCRGDDQWADHFNEWATAAGISAFARKLDDCRMKVERR